MFNCSHTLIRETEALVRLGDHPNIVKLLDLFKHKHEAHTYMVFELMKGGDLKKFIRQNHSQGMPIDMVIGFTE